MIEYKTKSTVTTVLVMKEQAQSEIKKETRQSSDCFSEIRNEAEVMEGSDQKMQANTHIAAAEEVVVASSEN